MLASATLPLLPLPLQVRRTLAGDRVPWGSECRVREMRLRGPITGKVDGCGAGGERDAVAGAATSAIDDGHDRNAGQRGLRLERGRDREKRG